MKDWFIKVGFKRFLWFVKLWYGLSMLVTRTRTPVKRYRAISEIPVALDYGKDWRPDPLKGALDVATHPTRFQERLDKAVPGQDGDEIGDCDDHAVYWIVALLKSRLVARCWLSFYQMKRVTDGRRSGHAVVVFEDHFGDFYWADYKDPYKINDKWDFATDSAAKFGSEPVGAGMIEIKRVTKRDSIKWGKAHHKVEF